MNSIFQWDPYHLVLTDTGEIIKTDRNPEKPTADENAIKFTRFLRKTQEQIHGSLKNTFSFANNRKIPTSYLLPFSQQFLQKHSLDDQYKHVPMLSFIIVCMFSLLNATHPGYRPHFLDERDQQRAARQVLRRMWLENPLLHTQDWPLDFDRPNSRCREGSKWTPKTFLALENNDVLNFPKVSREEINPKAIELCSGNGSFQYNIFSHDSDLRNSSVSP